MDTFLKHRLLWLLICLSVFANVTATEKANPSFASWYEFQSADGHFTIQFPAKPTVKTTTTDSSIGHITNHIIVSKISHSRFGVDYSDLPGFAVAFLNKDTIYSHATGSLLKKTLGKLQSSTDIQYQGLSGKHLIYDIPPIPDKPALYGEAYLFLHDKRLYVIDANAPAGTAKPQVLHYLNSLRFD